MNCFFEAGKHVEAGGAPFRVGDVYPATGWPSRQPPRGLRSPPHATEAFGFAMCRGAVARKTKETSIEVNSISTVRAGSDISTGVGFFDHMLDQLARHSLIDLTVRAEGDRHIDDHHTVEDVGIALGQALAKALGDKRGLARYADRLLPMDETLTRVALDISGRPFWSSGPSSRPKGSARSTRAGASSSGLRRQRRDDAAHRDAYGANSHHIAELCFKGVARALKAAIAIDPRQAERIPSTKGALGRDGMTVAIIDYGSGNLHPARKAFERAARDAGMTGGIAVTSRPEDVLAADRIVLPGVGAFADCRRGLDGVAGMVEALAEAVRGRGKPFLGICVGVQLTATRGLEHDVVAGLGLDRRRRRADRSRPIRR